ncbi:MAG: hypothetical protein ABR559_04560 [Gemmatimonadota bacterium]
MIEIALIAVLALHGIVCTTILAVVLWRAARFRETQWPALPLPVLVEAPDKLEPPTQSYEARERYPAETIFPIMAEYFPIEYDRYRAGRLGYAERRWVWEACCAICNARSEIEELCS